MEPLQYEARGYLKEPFRLFHLADGQRERIEYHYHTFHKIIILLAGKAGYAIEGERYDLTPGDFVLVGRGSIHRPEVEEDAFYERMILYISPAYLASLGTEDCDLEACFRQAQTDFRYVYRDEGDSRVRPLFELLARTAREGGYGAALLERAEFLELMVEVNRVCRGGHQVQAAAGDRKVVALLQYLNLHLTEELSIDQLAERFYISKYHMMRRFRQETGYSIHDYLTEKRLLLAQRLLERHGAPYLSIDHLKMGLIRSGQTTLTPTDDQQLTDYLWSIVREMVQTVIENHQNLIVEGCYIPFHWKEDFSPQSLRCIRSLFLVMSEEYIRSHFPTIRSTANVIEQRLDDSWCTLEQLLEDNRFYLENCTRHSCPIAFIQDEYPSFEQFCTLLEL